MNKRLLTVLMALLGCAGAHAQLDYLNYRTYNGENNNLQHPAWGSTHTELIQISPLGFEDGYQAPGGVDRPNPRTISNSLFAQSGLINDPTGLSDFCWVWGQFLDHDFGLTPDGPEPMFIQVPAGDVHFDPLGMGTAIIPMNRNITMPGTGTNSGNPRRFPNEITAFIDGSNVYGSDEVRANWLRTFEGGKLKTSAGNLLPYNTMDGEFSSEIDPNAPHMDNPIRISNKIFVAGDPRANENPVLASMHTLFVREHNRQCTLLAEIHPDWNDEQLYQHARKMVSGLIQSVVYDEWLPAVGVILPEYTGYQDNVNPQVFNEFTAAAFRLGHTLLSSNLMRLDQQGNPLPQGDLSLRDAFFNPQMVPASGGIEPFFKGMAVQNQQKFDNKVVDDVRNFLFGQPGVGGLDLASININRGRERGLPGFNAIRQSFGLSRYSIFQQINSSAQVYARLLTLYETTDEIDPWVGMLCERPLPGTIFGQTVYTILQQQFTNLRDGDRFFYLNDPVLTQEEKDYIRNTTLRDIIMYNTNIVLMQDNVFGAIPHSEICANMTLDLNGLVRTPGNIPVANVDMHLGSLSGETTLATNASGHYQFDEMPFCELSTLSAHRGGDDVLGVTTQDIIRIQRHILGTDLLDNPYQYIAADVNNSNSVSTLDLIQIRRLILGIDTEFSQVPSWKFVLASFDFPEGVHPLETNYPQVLDFATAPPANFNSGFIAVKMGDINGNNNLNDEGDLVDNRSEGLVISLNDMLLEAGKTYTARIVLAPQDYLEGWQFGIEANNIRIDKVAAQSIDDAYFAYGKQALRMSWNTTGEAAQTEVLEMTFTALQDGQLSQMLHLSSALAAEAYPLNGNIQKVNLRFANANAQAVLAQNHPNPFHQSTAIGFELPTSASVSLHIIDASGKLVWKDAKILEAGAHNWSVHAADLPGKGTYTYQLILPTGVLTKRMVVQ